MFNKKYKSALEVHEKAIKKLEFSLQSRTNMLVESERELHEAKHSVKYWKEKYKDLEDDYDKLKKKKKK